MPKFSNNSDLRLDTCHPLLQELFREIIKTEDCAIVEGHRARRRQNQLYRMVLQKSKVKWPDSKHNVMPSMAVDAGPWLEKKGIPWGDSKQFYYFAGKVKAKAVEMGIQVRWGGDWDGDGDVTDQNFNDLAHWELLSTQKMEV